MSVGAFKIARITTNATTKTETKDFTEVGFGGAGTFSGGNGLGW
jgi:hypothetical protein